MTLGLVLFKKLLFTFNANLFNPVLTGSFRKFLTDFCSFCVCVCFVYEIIES